VKQQVLMAAQQAGGQAQIDDSLLDEVTALVEWPQAIAGRFEKRFLDVPHEALISTMQDHQKYFPVVDEQGKLLPAFVTVANIESRDIQAVRTGNERVIRPRFADAMFFWDEDRSTPLKSHLDSLKSLVFQKRLGSVFDKVIRVEQLAAFIARQINADVSATRQAARLCKCDLQTQMVGEFPELQGVMGAHLARHEGLSDDIACALEDHYLPRRAGDELPRNDIGRALALADRLDTLIGIFAIGQPPTGAKDPFALRRAALGVLRIIIEQNLDLDLRELLQQAAEGLSMQVAEANDHVLGVFEFITERQHAYSTDRGIRPDVFQAVSATGTTRPLDFEQRMQAVNAFLALPEAEALAAANKRIGNILRKNGIEGEQTVNPKLLQDAAEKQLYQQITALENQVEQQLADNDFTAALNTLAGLALPVDAFFDQVMVMADDPDLKANRIALLQSISGLFMRIADIGQLQR
ncbi:MAG TPA: glycine--tRNA ligase subunit beta, partial [Halothiobacillaceae bacterium]|nr:glycine--tRNA ligase subunit beta [Halothiobacillaceae bacterium]